MNPLNERQHEINCTAWRIHAAIEYAKAALSLEIGYDWISTTDINPSLFERYAGIWIAPGSPYKNMYNTQVAIHHAREHNIPCFGTCGGFQHMIIEYARNVLGFKDAQHAEYDPYASQLFISELIPIPISSHTAPSPTGEG